MEKEKKKLRIGILVDDSMIPHWSYRMIERVKNEAGSELILALRVKPKKKLIKQDFLKNWKELFFNTYNLLDKKINKSTPNAFETKNLKDLLSVNSTFIDINLEGDKIEKHVLNELKKFELDVLIKITNKPCKAELSKVSQFGIWSLHPLESNGDERYLAGFREVFEGIAETEITLYATFEGCKKSILFYKTSFSSDLLSISRNRNIFYWKASSIISSKIEELSKLGEILFFEKIKEINDQPIFKSRNTWPVPSNIKMLFDAPRLMLSKIKNKYDLTFNFHQWILLFRICKTEEISTDLSKFQKIIPPRDRFWADPHVLKRGDIYYIFFEELIYRDNKGYICLIEMDEHGNYSDPVKILEKNYHLSYPFLIEENNELYMIPESKQNNTIELYRCTQFPLKWDLEKILMKNIKAVDSSILFQDNKYWLFCSITNSEEPFAQDELHLFYSDKLVSDEWIAHPENPIVSDFKRSRPAGKIFKYKDKIYRPAQNGLKCYGYGIAINQVIEMTESNYEEKLVDSILPEWGKDIIGTHTINSVGNLTIIDALVRRKKKSKDF
ncbi:hypothetical protein [Daejeonella sp.]|uniref:glucosamine inositolphosphorylceramide transferase family protein n=1 Tax=Daejeonella sp. TaxID=2805397 RepID=UPI0025C27EFA|nr:hypothetical protein [Daejeonella sp.]